MGFSANKFGIMVYPESFNIDSIVDIIGGTSITEYAYIIHDKDVDETGSLKKSHCHIYVKLKGRNNADSDNVAKWFGILPNAVQKVHKWADALLYCTHKNAPEKFQYPDSDVITNMDISKVVAERDGKKRLEEIVNDIVNGNIREYNRTTKITGLEFVKYKTQIDRALDFRKENLEGVERDMECVYITGDSQCGKTTYAKLICKEKGLSLFVSSSSNDVLFNYKGQDVILLDDLRPSVLGLSDLLKMLDNNTASTVKSRYSNKVLECKMIIITSILPIDTFFHNVFSEEDETIVQLKRRCKTHIYMKSHTMDISFYDDELRGYDVPITAENPVSQMYRVKRSTKEEQIEKMKSVLGNVKIVENPSNMEELIEIQGKFDWDSLK